VAMRRADGPRTQMYVACFDLPTGPTPIDDSEDDSRPVGRMKWRTKVASGATIRGGDVDEIGNTLLTLSHGKVYCNTNLGAVASLNADNGKVDWVVTYPRATFRSGNVDRAEDHFFRDLTPCMIAKDLAVVAPMDGPAVFAVERCSGRVIWSLAAEQGTDIVHLIGSTGNVVHASGDALYWIDLQSGRIVTQYPHAPPKSQGLAPPSPRGFGRGIVAGDQVYWPTRDSLYVFAAQPVKTDTGWRPQGVRDISLVQRGATGGNLTIAGGVLLIAGSERLYAFDEQGPAGTDESQKVEIR
jgi:outer membrane protein assembly factor BamB